MGVWVCGGVGVEVGLVEHFGWCWCGGLVWGGFGGALLVLLVENHQEDFSTTIPNTTHRTSKRIAQATRRRGVRHDVT